jgi:rSAM/selenodomain-associated transferase 2
LSLSVIVPTWNEASTIGRALRALQVLRHAGHDLIVVDGGSRDDTVLLARPWADRVVRSEPGRARQMNAGARRAAGDVLLFVHADTLLPEDADQLIARALQTSGRAWGRFDVRLSGAHPVLRLVERLMNWRSRLTGIATGDQAMFVRRDLFEAAGGFPEIPLMEDIAISRRLKKHGRPVCLKQRVLTSSRRWEEQGVVRTIWLMWRLRTAFFLGADPRELARRYEGRPMAGPPPA